MRTMRLRTKFLLSLLAISTGLTCATLAVVSYSVRQRVRQSLREDLRNSVMTYQTFEHERAATFTRSAELLADLPTVRALMSTEDIATIEDSSEDIWRLSGSDLLVLANRAGDIVALRNDAPEFRREDAQDLLRESARNGAEHDWWFGGGHLYEVWIQPIYFGPSSQNVPMGILVVGHEIDNRAARNFGTIVGSDVVVRCGDTIVASTLSSAAGQQLLALNRPGPVPTGDVYQDVRLDREHFLVGTVTLSSGDRAVTLSALKSFDRATAFLTRLNRILVLLGILSLVIGGAVAYFISHTFTRPLAALVAGVRALGRGEFNYPLDQSGGDEVAEVTQAFDNMRTNLQNTQKEQQQLEERLRQSHKMEAVGRLAGGVAHDFNNLLTVIKGNSDLLADQAELDGMQRRWLEQVQKAASRAVSMTRQLLAFSRMQVLEPRALDLNTMVADMSKMLPRLIGENIEFQFVPEPSVATVRADPGQMEQILLNLAVNARDAMPNGGKLVVRTRNVVVDEIEAAKHPPMTPGKFVLLSVKDTGHGMDEKTKAHIFEPFFTTKGVGRGTGLGLATVYGVVKQSNGFIWVESAPNEGATFEIYLPASAKSAPDPAEEAKAKFLPRGSETILLVEDESAVRELASEFLRSAGYTVVEAQDGAQALEIASRHPGTIHALVADLVMPRMGGAELAGQLRLLRPGLRTLFMTGYSEYTTDKAKDSSDRAAVLQKPFSQSSLLEAIRAVLAARPGATRREYQTSRVS